MDNFEKKIKIQEIETITNSLSDISRTFGGGMDAGTSPTSQPNTIIYDTSYYLITTNRILLNFAYVKHGIIKNFIDVPVDDAFSKGVQIKTKELNGKQLKQLHSYIERESILATIAQSLKWGRLFGGAGIVILTDQNPAIQLKEDLIKPGGNLKFYAADFWELTDSNLNYSNPFLRKEEDIPYNLYGKRIHKSNVLRVLGKEPPSIVRPRLRGFGLSEVESVIRALNSYLKIQDVIYQLLDEAKIDVYGVKNFNTSLATQKGTEAITKRIILANHSKNYMNGICVDTEDTYHQKQIAFSGLSDMYEKSMLGVASALRMTIPKLFGTTATGFGSGDDGIENYNAMVESEIRAKCKYLVIDVIDLCCRHLFGFCPEDLTIEWESLRILKHTEEQTVKTEEFNRTLEAFNSGLIDGQDAVDCINHKNLLPVTVKLSKEGKMVSDEGDDKVKNSSSSNINYILSKICVIIKNIMRFLKI